MEQPRVSSKELVPRIRGMVLEKTVLVEIKYIRFQTETGSCDREVFLIMRRKELTCYEQLKRNMTIN